MSVPPRARAVVVGGGIVGLSVAFHLARIGWTDVVLLERRRLTSGTAWHAAGLIARMRGAANLTRLARCSQELYAGLEAETGVATGFRRVGSITVALTAGRMEELRRQAAMARAFGVEVEEVGLGEVGRYYRHLSLAGVEGGVFLPKDGQGDPTGICPGARCARRNWGWAWPGSTASPTWASSASRSSCPRTWPRTWPRRFCRRARRSGSSPAGCWP